MVNSLWIYILVGGLIGYFVFVGMVYSDVSKNDDIFQILGAIGNRMSGVFTMKEIWTMPSLWSINWIILTSIGCLIGYIVFLISHYR